MRIRLAKGYQSAFFFHASIYIYSIMIAKDFSTLIYVTPIFLAILYKSVTTASQVLTLENFVLIVLSIFFILGPAQALVDGQTSFSYQKLRPTLFFDHEILKTFLILYIALFCIIFIGLKNVNSNVRKRNLVPHHKSLLFIFFLSFIGIIMLSGGYSNLSAGRYQKIIEIPIYVIIPQSLFIISALFLLITYKRNFRGKWALISQGFLVLCLLAFVFNPFNTPRFVLIMVWLPVLLIFLRGRLNYAAAAASVIASLLFILPLLSITTRAGSITSNTIEKIISLRDFQRIGFLDVFELMLHAVRYVSENGLAYGSNIQAIILSFVPRSIWPDKPLVSSKIVGATMVERGEAGTNNLSMFFAGDLYLDFGILGVIVGSVVIGSLFLWIRRKMHNQNVLDTNVLIFISIASSPILVRGPLAAVITPFEGLLAAYFLLSIFFCHYESSVDTRKRN